MMNDLRENEFSDQEIFDFVRCQRKDGTFYGTAGRCRSGTMVGPREKKILKAAADKGNVKAAAALAVVEGKKTPAQARKELGMGGGDKAGTQNKAKPVKKKKPLKKMTAEDRAKLGLDDEIPKKKPAKKKPVKKKKEEAQGGGGGQPEIKGTGEPQAEAYRNRLKTKDGRDAALKERNSLYKDFAEQAAPPPPEKNISRKAAKSIEDYTRDRPPSDPTSYGNMNNCARNPPSCTPQAQRANRDLDGALRAAPTNSTGGAYFRGMNLTDNPQLATQLENLKPGDTFKDAGFGSYSRSPQSATTFLGDRNNTQTRNFMMISKSKKIRQIEDYSDWPDELEGVLPRNASQTVRSVRHVGNTTYIEVD